MIAISMLVILRWKSDLIIEKVISSVQEELVDTIQYTTADINWFSHFPLMSIQIYDLHVGSAASTFIHDCDVDIVIALFPLFKNQIIINQLAIKDGAIYIHEKQGRWSYDILKNKGEESSDGYATKISQLVIENVTIQYEETPSSLIDLFIEKGVFKGNIEEGALDTELNLQSTLNKLTLSDYVLPAPFQSSIKGQYRYEFASGKQLFDNLEIDHEAIQLAVDGHVEKDTIDLSLQWKKANPAMLKNWLPTRLAVKTKGHKLEGVMEGQSHIKGLLSKPDHLNIIADLSLKNGSITFIKSKEAIKGISLDLNYNSHNREKGNKPSLDLSFEKSGMTSPNFKGALQLANFSNPVFDLSLDGALPSGLLNLMEVPGLKFESGVLEIDNLALKKIQSSKFSMQTFFEQGIESVSLKDLHFTYHDTAIKINKGSLALVNHQIKIDFDKLDWNKASFSELKCSVTSADNKLDYQVSGQLCEGAFTTEGVLSGIDQRPLINASWKVTGIQINKLLESFSNFDQTFITSENLSGKTNLWVETKMPFDEKWNLLSKNVVVKAAIDIHDGRLQGMPAFEEFSKFVHLEDLRDIRFNQIRNYMLIEKGQVYLPVMFIQSNALNLSISGSHGFDEKIIYYLKLNAGQVAATKLKKNKGNKDFLKASKSGWINMYFALSGTTQDVRYQQYKNAVIAGFEQSTVIKEKLRDELVEKFGYDVYWLEPNEWEDIPEYY